MTERFNVLSRLMVGFSGGVVPKEFAELSAKGLRSVVLYGENVESPSQLAELTKSLRASLGPDAVIAIDEEGGDVTRVDYLVGSRFAGNSWLGQHNDLNVTRRDGRMVASVLAGLGINLNFAPDADVNTNPLNPVIGNRSFGTHQVAVAGHVAAFVEGHEARGVGTTLKHFPGHGNVVSDSHLTLPRVPGGLAELEADHLEPFRSGIQAGASAVMLAHLDLGDGRPTSLSQSIVNKLRYELGFEGLIITDALDMGAITSQMSIAEAAVEALLAGNDLVCLGPRTSTETLMEILELWKKVPSDVARSNEVEASARLAAFLEGHRGPSPVETPEPTYGMTFEIPPRFQRADVVRISSGTNPAVGDAPWLNGAPFDREIDPQELGEQLASGDPIVAITRGGELVWKTLEDLSEAQLEKMFLITTEAPPRLLGCELLVTYGSAQPQALALASALSRKESRIV